MTKEIYIPEKLTYPFNTPEFIETWGLWLAHRREIKKPIKGKISQQAALKKIGALAEGKEPQAIAIIMQSLENNWRGLFKLKTENNVTETNDDDLIEALKRRFEN